MVNDLLLNSFFFSMKNTFIIYLMCHPLIGGQKFESNDSPFDRVWITTPENSFKGVHKHFDKKECWTENVLLVRNCYKIYIIVFMSHSVFLIQSISHATEKYWLRFKG